MNPPGTSVVYAPCAFIVAARDFAPDVYTITGIQLESMDEYAGFHGVNERIRVDEYGKTIGFFYQLMDNLEGL